jgi:hypothetical protein
MKIAHKNRAAKMPGVFLVLPFLVLSGCAGQMRGAQDRPFDLKSKKEMLVAMDAGNGKGISAIEWCGKNRIIFRIDGVEARAVVLDILSKERLEVPISDYADILNCTPDGKKVLYLDEKSTRLDETIEGPEREILPGVYCCVDKTVDIYMYDTETGERTFIASIRSGGNYDALSPDGKKILLGKRHRLAGKAPGVEWEDVWFSEMGWELYNAVWFPDSTGFVAGTGFGNTICVEFLGKDGWAKCFTLDVDKRYLKIDGKNNIYFYNDYFAPLFVDVGDFFPERNRLYRCALKDRELFCERMLAQYDVMAFYGILPNGDIVFGDYDNFQCILQSTRGGQGARCVIGTAYGDAVYDHVYMENISPDQRWLLFERYYVPQDRDKGPWRVDLFLIDLESD